MGKSTSNCSDLMEIQLIMSIKLKQLAHYMDIKTSKMDENVLTRKSIEILKLNILIVFLSPGQFFLNGHV